MIDRTEAESYLTACFDDLRPNTQSFVWISWLDAIATLGFEFLRPLVVKAFDAGLVSPNHMDMDDFDQLLEGSLFQGGGETFLRQQRLEPFTDAIGTFSKWYAFSDEYIRSKREYQDKVRLEAEDVVTDPYRKVGRNDPCPCGSGKKYKKCCLN